MPLAAALVRLAASRVGWFFAAGDQRDAEILALRHQILVLQRQINRPQFTDTDRAILAILSRAFDRRRFAEVFLNGNAGGIQWKCAGKDSNGNISSNERKDDTMKREATQPKSQPSGDVTPWRRT